MEYKDFDYITMFILKNKTSILDKTNFFHYNKNIENDFLKLLDKYSYMNNHITIMNRIINELANKYTTEFLNFIINSVYEYFIFYETIKKDII